MKIWKVECYFDDSQEKYEESIIDNSSTVMEDKVNEKVENLKFEKKTFMRLTQKIKNFFEYVILHKKRYMNTEEDRRIMEKIISVINIIDKNKISNKYYFRMTYSKDINFEFIEEIIEMEDVFLVYSKEEPIKIHEIYVSDRFKKIVEDNNLGGFEFTEIWSDEK